MIPRTYELEIQSVETCSFQNKLCILKNDFSEDAYKGFLEWQGVTLAEDGIFLTISKKQNYGLEEYSITIEKNQISIEANSEKGVIWAFRTLSESIQEGKLKIKKVHDFPKYSHRGISLDCARHFFPAEEVKKIIDQISRVKMNVLHWHLSDDQGFRVESKRFPKLGEKSKDFYTQEEIRDIVEYSESEYNTIKTYINRIRNKFTDCDVFEIQSVRGLGYKVIINENKS